MKTILMILLFINIADSMVGDVNLFLLALDEEEFKGKYSSQIDIKDKQQAEIEIMIAESLFRRQGRGREATWLMLKYGNKIIQV